MYRCIVIDDEALARERIAQYISRSPLCEVVAEASSYQSAKQLILEQQPDICFLDIQIIGGNGVELAKELQNYVTCHWVFTTAHSEYALTAFELEATDYLLKPFEDSRLAQVIAKIHKKQHSNMPINQTRRQLPVKSVGSVKFINTQDIIWVKGSANYVELYCEAKMHLHRETLSALEQTLDPKQFIRVHRSAIVNIDCIHSLNSELGRFSLLQLDNGHEVKIGQSYKAQLFSALGVDVE
ncbi:LytTR family DNA-binding domain-containing protein [Paraglaciecola sp. 20A4]|uniref:LytR/AlgR family response regulator transcription factor n=1 Tax=Paraglaciecola sp. 20A4 TaxID=2687288 RepID=UPI00140729FD|nr:LytTR family DNA-binding domain-containing protein [Paraglaciecola sp. 20A4]